MRGLNILSVKADVVYPLRRSILHREKSFGFSLYPADSDETTLHLGAYFQGELVGIASIYLETTVERNENAAWRLRDMGVVESMRRKEVGSALIDACCVHIAANQGTLIWCYARRNAVPFYLAHAFQQGEKPIYLEGFGQRFFMWRSTIHDH